MCRLYGFLANEPTKVECTLVHAQNALLMQSRSDLRGVSHPDGWGIGFYHGDEVLHKKRPTRAGALVDWQTSAGDVRSECAVLHMRQPTVGDFRAENAHPFRMRSRYIFQDRFYYIPGRQDLPYHNP